jgi:hypothetical protein
MGIKRRGEHLVGFCSFSLLVAVVRRIEAVGNYLPLYIDI